MRRLSTLVLVAMGFALVLGVLPAHAQDILGLSLRPTDAMPEQTARGSADIVSDNGGYLVSVDLSPAADTLSSDAVEDGDTLVVWAVDMDGFRHNVGTLDDNFVLEDASVDFLVARLFISAESSADVDQPSGDALFRVTLRNVEEQEGPAPEDDDSADEAATDSETEDEMAADDEAETEATEEDEPDELPTTGGPIEDLLVLVIVATALLAAGWRLRAVRV